MEPIHYWFLFCCRWWTSILGLSLLVGSSSLARTVFVFCCRWSTSMRQARLWTWRWKACRAAPHLWWSLYSTAQTALLRTHLTHLFWLAACWLICLPVPVVSCTQERQHHWDNFLGELLLLNCPSTSTCCEMYSGVVTPLRLVLVGS